MCELLLQGFSNLGDRGREPNFNSAQDSLISLGKRPSAFTAGLRDPRKM